MNLLVSIPFCDLEQVSFLSFTLIHVYTGFFITGLFMTMNQIIYIELSAQCSALCGNSRVTAIVVATLPPTTSKHHEEFRML